MILALRIGLVIGGAIDLYVAVLAIVAPALIPPLLDIPASDPLALMLGGGEYAVVAALYAVALRDPVRFRALLPLCALDQLVAVVLPAWLIVHHAIPATWKTVAPIPLQAALAILFLAGTRLGEGPSWDRGVAPPRWTRRR